MMKRITQSNVDGAFKRLHRAMEWPNLSPWNSTVSPIKANIGAAYLSQTGYGYQIEVVENEGGGVSTPFPGWSSKREAFNTMACMAAALETYKRNSPR